jgi:hypothetical protein
MPVRRTRSSRGPEARAPEIIADFSDRAREELVLGDIAMHSGNGRKYVDAGLTVDAFVDGDRRLVWAIIADLIARGREPDWATVTAAARRKGVPPAYIAHLIAGVPRQPDANIAEHVAALRTLQACRAFQSGERRAISQLAVQPELIHNGFLPHRVEELQALQGEQAPPEDDCSESLDDFFASTADPAAAFGEGLFPSVGAILAHGQPRARKSLLVVASLLSAAAELPPFGLERLAVTKPVRSLYLTEEDKRPEIKKRAGQMLRGLGLAHPPPAFRLLVDKGITLDDAGWQDRLIRIVARHQTDLLVLDPLRALTGSVDQGPSELAPLRKFIQRVNRESGATVLAVHHDVKPARDGKPDDRPRAQRASGGGVFSLAEAPIHIERVSDDCSLMVPDHWKGSSDPPSIQVRFTTGDGWLRLEGEDVEAEVVAELALHERLLTVLAEHPGMPGRRLAANARARKEDVYAALDHLAQAGKVDSVRSGRATRWFLSKGDGSMVPNGSH